MQAHRALDDVSVFSVAPLSPEELERIDGGTEDPGTGGHEPGRWCLSCILGRCGNGPIRLAS